MRFILALLLAAASARAGDGALRPITYPKDDRLTAGAISNFRSLYVDPEPFVKGLVPEVPPSIPATAPSAAPPVAPSFPPAGTLLVRNEQSAWAEVAVNDQKVGVIGPYTVGALVGVRWGGYATSAIVMTTADEVPDPAGAPRQEIQQPQP